MAAVDIPTTPLLSNRSIGIRRNGSFTDVEKYFLRALLLDSSTTPEKPPQQQQVETKSHLQCIGDTSGKRLVVQPARTPQSKALDDKILFQALPLEPDNNNNPQSSKKFGRHEKKILGLWQAHEDGAHPVIMKKHHRRKSSGVPDFGKVSPSNRWSSRNYSQSASGIDDARSRTSSVAAESIYTDREVRHVHEHDDNSSWGEEDGGFVHYDAWEVLKDEYAEDFGFDYRETLQSIQATLSGNDEDCQTHVFSILGTSADDQSAQPHVLSPPLMDSLLNFVPETLSMENWWMKFSLLRDGCSLYTLKQYVKASPYTLLAIETTRGDVFGAFTSHIWRNHPTFYGNAPAFLWRMRHNRRTPCHSLFDQAQMESEIDTYPYSGLNDLFQVCEEDRLAIGGGKLVPDWDMTVGPDGKLQSTGNSSTVHGIDLESLEQGQSYGFGLCLDDNLLSGTTSPCGTFRNPCLVNPMSKGEVFEVANLEMWTLTPAADVTSAEKMELTRFFVEESLRTVSTSTSSSINNDMYSNQYNNQEEFQRDFYRRIGHNEPTRHQRNGSFEFRHIIAPSSRR